MKPGASDWKAAADAAKEAFKKAVNSWAEHSQVTGGTVNGPNAHITPGSLTSIRPFESAFVPAMASARVDMQVVQPLARELGGAWKSWAEGFQIQLPGAFPTLAAFPGPQAPPTPGQGVFPLRQGSSAGEARLRASMLSSHLTGTLSRQRVEDRRELVAAMEELARWVEKQFREWTSQAHLQGHRLQATGPVPTFAPPYVPVGPVVNGRLLPAGAPGVIGGVPFGAMGR